MIQNNPVGSKIADLGKRFVPTSAYIEVTTRCNAKCAYCYSQDNSSIPELDTKGMCGVLDILCESGILFLTLTGGEPFAREDILDILRHAVKRKFFRVHIMTNGIALRKEHLDFLICHVDSLTKCLSMSAYSHIPEINDRQFGVQGALDTIVRNADYLLGRGMNVLIKVNVFDFNMSSFQESVSYFRQLGFHAQHYFSKITTKTNSAHIKECGTQRFIREYLGQLTKDELDRKMRLFSARMASQKPGGFCGGRITSICVDPAGRVRPCTVFPRDASDFTIFDPQSLSAKLRESKPFRIIREVGLRDFDRCTGCGFMSFCSPCIAKMYCDGILQPPPQAQCNYAQAMCDISSAGS